MAKTPMEFPQSHCGAPSHGCPRVEDLGPHRIFPNVLAQYYFLHMGRTWEKAAGRTLPSPRPSVRRDRKVAPSEAAIRALVHDHVRLHSPKAYVRSVPGAGAGGGGGGWGFRRIRRRHRSSYLTPPMW